MERHIGVAYKAMVISMLLIILQPDTPRQLCLVAFSSNYSYSYTTWPNVYGHLAITPICAFFQRLLTQSSRHTFVRNVFVCRSVTISLY